MPTPYQSSTASPVTVTSTLTDVLILKCNGQLDEAALTVTNTGSNPVTSAALLAQYADAGPFFPWISANVFHMTCAATDNWSSNPTPDQISVGQTAVYRFKPGAVVAVKLQVASTLGTTVTATFGGRAVGGATEAPRQGIEI